MNRQSGLQRIDSQPSASFATSNRMVSNRDSEGQQQQFNQNQHDGYQPNSQNSMNQIRSGKQSFNNYNQYNMQSFSYQQYQDQHQQQSYNRNNQPYSQERIPSTRNSQQNKYGGEFQQGVSQRPVSSHQIEGQQKGYNGDNYYESQIPSHNNFNNNQANIQNNIEPNEQQFQESQTNMMKNYREENAHLQTDDYIFPQNALITFLRKLYSLLLIQTIIILVSLWFSYLVADIVQFIGQNMWIVWTSLGIVIAITVGCFVFRHAVSYSPLNYILLVIQTVALVILYGYLMDNYNIELAFLILIALAAVYFSLLIYVLTTKTELNFRGSTLFVTCSAVMIYQLFLIFTDLSYLTSIFILMGIVIWGYFLVYEYQTKVSDVEFERRDPVISTVTVFLDIFNLCLKVSDLLRQILLKERS